MRKLFLFVIFSIISTSHAQDEIFFGKFEDYFVGPLGCTDNCYVEENTDFYLHWSIQDKDSCSVSVGTKTGGKQIKLAQNSYLVNGGITGSTTYNLDCPAAKTNEYNLTFVRQETFSLALPEDQRMMLRVVDDETIMINLVEIENMFDYKLDNKLKLNQYAKHLWYTQLSVPKDFDYKQNLASINLENITTETKYNKIWFSISEQDPRIMPVDYAYDGGLCDSLSKNPAINITTVVLIDANFENECVLEANKEYFITKVYLLKN